MQIANLQNFKSFVSAECTEINIIIETVKSIQHGSFDDKKVVDIALSIYTNKNNLLNNERVVSALGRLNSKHC